MLIAAFNISMALFYRRGRGRAGKPALKPNVGMTFQFGVSKKELL
jgi:hypothetical protein